MKQRRHQRNSMDEYVGGDEEYEMTRSYRKKYLKKHSRHGVSKKSLKDKNKIKKYNFLKKPKTFY